MKENLKYFINKVCTVTTLAINFKFQYEQMVDYFTGKIDSIDDDGILMTHHITNCKNYIFLSHVVSIAEEQVLYKDNPNHAKIIDDYEKEKPLTAEKLKIIDKPPETVKTPYVNPSDIQKMLKKANL
jgi:hypothetical protein